MTSTPRILQGQRRASLFSYIPRSPDFSGAATLLVVGLMLGAMGPRWIRTASEATVRCWQFAADKGTDRIASASGVGLSNWNATLLYGIGLVVAAGSVAMIAAIAQGGFHADWGRVTLDLDRISFVNFGSRIWNRDRLGGILSGIVSGAAFFMAVLGMSWWYYPRLFRLDLGENAGGSSSTAGTNTMVTVLCGSLAIALGCALFVLITRGLAAYSSGEAEYRVQQAEQEKDRPRYRLPRRS